MPKTEDRSIVMQQQSRKAIEQAESLEVKTPEQYNVATELLVKIKTVAKMVKTEQDKMLKPILEAEKVERARWKPVLTEAQQAEAMIKEKMLAYVNETERLARQKEDEIRRKMEEGKIKKPETALKQMEQVEQAPQAVKPTTGGASQVRKVRVVKITNPDEVPDQYWILNEVMIRRDALAGTEIPGVQVVEENTIAGISR